MPILKPTYPRLSPNTLDAIQEVIGENSPIFFKSGNTLPTYFFEIPTGYHVLFYCFHVSKLEDRWSLLVKKNKDGQPINKNRKYLEKDIPTIIETLIKEGPYCSKFQ